MAIILVPANTPVAVVDFETYYKKTTPTNPGIDISFYGVWHYLRHPMVGGCDDGIHTVSIVTEDGEWVGRPWEAPWDEIDKMRWVSHNASFDSEVYRAFQERHGPQKSQPVEWQCSANMAAFYGVKRALDGACKALLGIEVDKGVRAAMNKKTLAIMQADPDFFRQMEQYALNDSRYCYQLWMEFNGGWPDIEKRISLLTMKQVERGLPCNIEKLDQGIKDLDRVAWEASNRLPWVNDGSEKAVLSLIHLAEACRELGIEPPKSTAEDDPRCIAWEEKYGDEVTLVADMRAFRKSNLLSSKLKRMRSRVRSDGRIAYGVKYGGGHTMRWTGDTGFNVHGFQKDPFEATLDSGRKIKVDMRSMLEVKEPKRKLIIADLSQIEPRVAKWFVADWEWLEKVRKGMSVYEVHARQTMGWKGGKLKDEDKGMYAYAKARVLGLQYGCGHIRFREYAKTEHNLDLTPVESKKNVNDFRHKEKAIVQMWDRLDLWLRQSVKDGELSIELPSWRAIKFQELAKETHKDKKTGRVSTDFRATLGTGRRGRLWGSKIFENIVQATSRDAFAEAMLRVEDKGIETILSVHDEMIIECDESVKLEDVVELIRVTPEWMPGIPLDCEAENSKFYKK